MTGAPAPHAPAPHAEEPSSGLPARRAACEILYGILGEKRGFDEAAGQSETLAALEGGERAFARRLALTALRHAGEMEALIAARAERPPGIDVRILLYLGLAQLLWTEVPAHAAVDTAVRLAGESGLGAQKKFLNALLRRTARDKSGALDGLDPYLCNIPAWLRENWEADYGAETAREIALASLTEAPLDITLKAPGGEAAIWAERLGAALRESGTLRRPRAGGLTELPGYEDGSWWVQDEAAARPVRLLGDVAGRRVFDMCAAPGGKTMQLAAGGAAVTAVDRSKPRLGRLSENLDRTGLADMVNIVQADAAAWQPEEPADIVLLDAPCSATGTIRRHPDLLHLKGEGDVAKLAALQARLLDRAPDWLAPGGRLLYCTCSLQKAEGEAQVAAFLQRDAGRGFTLEREERLLPGEGGDGFYIALLRRA